MHSRFNKSRRKEDGFFEKWGYGFLVLPVLLAVAMIFLSVVQPKTNWIADIVHGQGSDAPPIDTRDAHAHRASARTIFAPVRLRVSPRRP